MTKNDKDQEGFEGELIPYQNAGDLAEFMKQPTIKIAEAITGAIAVGPSGLAQVAGRIAQGALKGKCLEQLGKELIKLAKDGKIKEDYPEHKYGFKSFTELLDFIDSEAPEEDRLKAVKAMFVGLIAFDAKEGQESLNYEIFKTCMELSSIQLLILKAIYKLREKNGDLEVPYANDWFHNVAAELGHGISSLVEKEEEALMNLRLISQRRESGRSMIYPKNWRLTDFGVRFCEQLAKYENIA